MREDWFGFISTGLRTSGKRLFGGTLVLLALVFGTARPTLAQRTCSPANLGDTCAITGTAGFETGLWDLGFLRLNKSNAVGVFWGDGQQSEGLVGCFRPVLHPNQCHVFGTHTYATPGTYTIRISYVPPGLFSSRTDTLNTATISPVGDFVILSIGDSVASGEGNSLIRRTGIAVDPDPPSSKGFWGWDDPGSDYCLPPSCPSAPITQTTPPEQAEALRNNCHRSFLAGPALAAGRVATTNPVTFVHLACSGAAVGQIGVPESDYPGRSNIVQQLRIARKHLERIDVLLISGGFNNMTFRRILYDQTGQVAVGFGTFVTRCLLHPFDPCENDPKFTTDIGDSIVGNPDRVLRGHERDRPDVDFRFPGLHREYEDLDKEIHCINPENDSPEPDCSEKQIPKLVLITEFFDPTHDETGNFKNLCLSIPTARWAYVHSVITDVNREVRNSPWPAVVGIQDDFLKHGLCADDADRWVVKIGESVSNQNDENGTGHPNGTGHADYRDRIYARMVELNPPVTTSSATVGGTPYPFGTWTGQDVEMTLTAKNFIKEAGLKQTFFAVDDPSCNFAAVSDDPNNPLSCSIYQGPFTISTSGQHTVTFFSLNGQGHPEALQSVQVWVDKNPPVSAVPGTLTIHQGQAALYRVAIGHIGWDNANVKLSCTTDAPLATCSVLPDTVVLDSGLTKTASATVVTTRGGVVYRPGTPGGTNPFTPLGELRVLLALATAVFLAAMAQAMRRQRWVRVTHFAALAVLFGALCAGCAGGTDVPGTPAGKSTVTITGTSGNTTQSTQVTLNVQ